jgi:hypothetical protein
MALETRSMPALERRRRRSYRSELPVRLGDADNEPMSAETECSDSDFAATVLEHALVGRPFDVSSDGANSPVSAAELARAISYVGSVDLRPLVVHILGPAHIDGMLDLCDARLPCPLVLELCKFECLVDLRNANLQSLRLPNSQCTGGLDATGITLGGSLELSAGFEGEGGVVFDRARVGRWIDCSQASFESKHGTALSLSGAAVDGDVLLCDGFRACGEVRLDRARIAGDLECDGGHFQAAKSDGTALSGDNIKVGGRINFGTHAVSSGTMDLRRAEVGSQIRIEGHSEAPVATAWNLEAARVVRAIVLCPSEKLVGHINMINATAGYLRDDLDNWGDSYDVSGLECGSLVSRQEAEERKAQSGQAGGRGRPGEGQRPTLWWRPSPTVQKRLNWLEENASGYQPQLYDQVAADYRRAGHEHAERCVLIEKERQRRTTLPPPTRAWSWIKDKLLGYGYRTWQALIPVAALLAAGILFFLIWPGDVEPAGVHVTRPFLWPVVYSAELLLPLVNTVQRESFTLRGAGPLVGLTLTISGWVLLTAIVAGITGFIRRPD